MDKCINDGMKEEGKYAIILTIFSYVIAILMLLANYLTNYISYSDKDIILITVFCFSCGTISLYLWLYSRTYKLRITQEKVILKTLFKSIEIEVKDITNYTYKRYMKSAFYQFNLFIKDKKVLVNTRFRDEFIEILKANKKESLDEKCL